MRRRIVLNTLVISIITVGALLINGCGKVETATVLANAETVYSEASETEESSEQMEETESIIEETESIIEETESIIEETVTEPIVEETETIQDESDITPLNQTMYSKGNVNIRSGPSTDYTKTGSLTTNQQVQVTGQSKSSGWYEIMISGQKSYVSNKYLSLEKVVVETPKPSNNTGNGGQQPANNSGTQGSGGSVTPQPSTGGDGQTVDENHLGGPHGFAGIIESDGSWVEGLGGTTPMQ